MDEETPEPQEETQEEPQEGNKAKQEAKASPNMFKSILHKIELTPKMLVLSRSFPPGTLEIPYGEIVSIEHRRLVDYGRLPWVIVGMGIAFAFLFVDFVRKIIQAFVYEVSVATGSTSSATVQGDPSIVATANQVSMGLAALCIIVAGYFMLMFGYSLGRRLLIYRTGKKPVATPLTLNEETSKLVAKLDKRVKDASGISKKEAKQILGEQVREMLNRRVQMQDKLMQDLQAQVKTAKTPAEKALVKLMLKEGIDKLEQQDEMIDNELKKTGLKKADIFKKYRIKAPDKSFIDSILKESDINPDDLPKK